MNANCIPDGTLCDTCGQVPATRRVLVDDTGFGKEYGYFCDACHEQESKSLCTGSCDWCKRKSNDLRWVKDSSEGMDDPLYLVCPRCAKAQQDRVDRDLEEYYQLFGFEYDYDDED
ncbi:MAG: hypothetical protein WC693_02360 [Patescibacteria group bacterium]|jgi:hypothetical protein